VKKANAKADLAGPDPRHAHIRQGQSKDLGRRQLNTNKKRDVTLWLCQNSY
jgi:hypothetical protein